MTDDTDPTAPLPPKEPIQTDRHGDPLPVGTAMIERESYERIIEGLKKAADRAAHLAIREAERSITAEDAAKARSSWANIALRLDLVRKIAIKKAGLEDPISARQTAAVRANPLPWRQARDEFRESLRQASGGCRQLATCFRGDLTWSNVATELERMVFNLKAGAAMRQRHRQRLGLWTPEGRAN